MQFAALEDFEAPMRPLAVIAVGCSSKGLSMKTLQMAIALR